MALAFVDREPTQDETQLLELAFSTFCDGSGMTKEGEYSRPGWRDFERAIGEVLGGTTPEGKQVFDVFVPDAQAANVDVGLSIKSKELTRKHAIGDLESGGRVYMELANSPAKFWASLSKQGIEESDFGTASAQTIGESILATVESWHHEAKQNHSPKDRELDLARSVYLTVSYSKPRANQERRYQVHSFPMDFPKGIKWQYRKRNSGPVRSIMGFDPQKQDEVIFDWYPLSGGQLKYYPVAETALYRTPSFTLLKPDSETILKKVARYWPDSIREEASGYVINKVTKGSTDSV